MQHSGAISSVSGKFSIEIYSRFAGRLLRWIGHWGWLPWKRFSGIHEMYSQTTMTVGFCYLKVTLEI